MGIDRNADLLRIAPMSASPFGWEVYGLDILWRNAALDVDPLTPYKDCMRFLVPDGETVAALVGGYAFEGEEWPSRVEFPFESVETTVYCGALFSYRAADATHPGIFYPVIDFATLVCPIIDKCLPHYNAVVVFVRPRAGETIARELNSALSESELIERLLAHTDWMIVPGHDGYSLKLLSSLPGAADTVQSCAESLNRRLWTQPFVLASYDWFDWDESYMCYALPPEHAYPGAWGGGLHAQPS